MAIDPTTSAFAKYVTRNYPHRYRCILRLETLAGGTPTDPKVAHGFIESKLKSKDQVLIEQIAELMVERGVTEDAAIEAVAIDSRLNGFKRHPELGLYIEGRQIKAMLKEAASIAAAEGRLPTKLGTRTLTAGKNKGEEGGGKIAKSWIAEHVFVVDDRVPLGRSTCDSIEQHFIHKIGPRGPQSAIQYDEVVRDAEIAFTVETDHQFSDEQWAAIWLTAERNGLGASRSQGCGRFVVLKWEPIPT